MIGTSKKVNLAPQPYHKSLESIQALFKMKKIGDPTTSSGWDIITSQESYVDMFKNELLKTITNDESAQQTFESMFTNTMRDVANPFSAGSFATEGADAMGVNANYNQLARLNPFTILGYIARSKVIDLFYTINSDRPTIQYEYNIDYVVKGTNQTKYNLPHAIRDGSLSGILDLPSAIPLVSVDNPHIEALPTGEGGANENWIKIGSSGNLLAETGIANPYKYTLERNVSIAKIRYSIPTSGSPVVGVAEIFSSRGFMEGEVSNRMFNESIQIKYKDGADDKVVTLTIVGVLNLDSSEYSVAQAGATSYITHFIFDAKISNPANEMDTVRGGSRKFVKTFDVNNKVTGTIPISQVMADDFNTAGEGVTWTAYMVDKMTEAYAGFRDLEMEGELDRAAAKPEERFDLYEKLGGFYKNVPFVLTARGPGGGDPFSWVRDGLKDMIRHVLTGADTLTHFETSTPRQWIMYGAEQDIQRIPEISYTNYAGEGDDGAAPGNYRFGFAVDTAAGFADNFGRRVKVIGSRDSRRVGKPIIAQLKSMSLEQPTTVYFPYSFRVYTGLSPEYRNVPSLCIFQRDYIGTLSKAQARISLVGNDEELYGKMSKFAASGAI